MVSFLIFAADEIRRLSHSRPYFGRDQLLDRLAMRRGHYVCQEPTRDTAKRSDERRRAYY